MSVFVNLAIVPRIRKRARTNNRKKQAEHNETTKTKKGIHYLKVNQTATFTAAVPKMLMNNPPANASHKTNAPCKNIFTPVINTPRQKNTNSEIFVSMIILS